MAYPKPTPKPSPKPKTPEPTVLETTSMGPDGTTYSSTTKKIHYSGAEYLSAFIKVGAALAVIAFVLYVN